MSRYESNQNEASTSMTPRGSRRVYWSLVALSVAVALIVAGGAMAGFGRRAMHGFHGGQAEEPDFERMREHMAFAIEFGLRKLDATPEQEAQIQSIADETFEAMRADLADRPRVHQELAKLASADRIDRTALEALRKEHIALADRASQTIVKAAADALEVLTPEQRSRVAEHMQSHRHHR